VEDGVEKEDWMKRATILATVCLLVMLALAPVALAQTPRAEDSPMVEETPAARERDRERPLPPSGGPAILLPAAALLVGSGVLTYAILRRR
jgi:hypothetical protein